MCGKYLDMWFPWFITSFGQQHVRTVLSASCYRDPDAFIQMLSAPPCNCSQLPRCVARCHDVSCCFQSQGKWEPMCNKGKTASASEIAASRGKGPETLVGSVSQLWKLQGSAPLRVQLKSKMKTLGVSFFKCLFWAKMMALEGMRQLWFVVRLVSQRQP